MPIRVPFVLLLSLVLILGAPAALAVTYSISVHTDKPTYSGSQKITIGGNVTPAPSTSTTAVVVTVKNPTNIVVDAWEASVAVSSGAYNGTTVAGGSPNWVPGTYIVNATWGGPGGTATTSVSFQYGNQLPSTATTVSCASPVAISASSNCSATVSGAQGDITGETVSFSLQPGGSGSVTFPSPASCSLAKLSMLGTDFSCSITVTGATAGGVTIKASYPGDAGNSPSVGTAILNVTPALGSTSTALSCVPSSIGVGAASTCTATVTGTTGNVAGTTITFSQTGGIGASVTLPSPATCALASGGNCSIMVTGANAGLVTLKASYPGDTNNSPSSGNFLLTVLVPTTTTSSSSSTSSTSTTSISSSVTKTSTTTSSSTTTTSSGGGLSSTVIYGIVAAAVVIVLLGVILLWRRNVAADYARRTPGKQ